MSRTFERHSIEDWTKALDLKRKGVERVGPCPLCGGADRFHVRPGRDGTGARVGCRGCIDGEPDQVKRKRYGELVRAVFSDRSRGNRSGLASTGVSSPPETQSTSETEALARQLWAASEPATSTPAHRYLARRWVWPAPGQGPSLPASVRWLNRSGGFNFVRLKGFPAIATGVCLFVYRQKNTGDLAAVSMEALTQDGDRPDWLGRQRWRRTYGPKTGATFEAAPGEPGQPVVLCEGEVTALAARWLHLGCRVLACGGTAGMREAAGLVHRQGRVLIVEIDGGEPGRKSARLVQKALPVGGADVRGFGRGEGVDAADELKETLSERVAMMEQEGGSTLTEAACATWAEVLGGGSRRE